MVLGFITMLAFQMLAYIVVFYTMSAAGIRMIMIMVTEFLTGAYVPYPFLPEKLQAFLNLTPFAAMQNLPLRVYSGNIAGAELVTQFQLQIFWLTALVLFGKLWMNRTLRRVIVQGG
jgi:ABC-2 type transport system permease protein